MSVTLIATVVALVLGHLAPSLAVSVRRYGWYRQWVGWLDGQFPEGGFWRGRWGIALALLPPLLAVGLMQRALEAQLLGLAELLFGIAVLFYAWGPRDLDVDVEAVARARDPASRREAAMRLSADGDTAPEGVALVEAVFRNAMRRWFGVLFWFLVLGPFGALLYRLLVLSVVGGTAQALPSRTVAGARMLLGVLEWPVAQLMTLALALVGNFDSVLGAWRDAGGASFRADHRFLLAAGRASVRSEMVEAAADAGYTDQDGDGEVDLPPPLPGELPELRDAMSLVWRCLLVWLAVLALFVIAGWVS
ncbi:membrane protein [Lysobacter arseniciresistens ZS79]|uniref:Membrane protein n=1 Tax=Lysobacter arseniciresistens ZS79 TaxID=913325 RepID=A0A0A0F2A7_9GAMM|nr:membrane protein [Lysobacter arseniciresistens]KGM56458.1 membrane protein [Lysobacter arseniciresistens ZS79]